MKNTKTIAEKAIGICRKPLFFLTFSLALASQAHATIPIEQWTLPNGAQIFWVSSPSIPIVDVQIDFDGGGRRDPVGKIGLASATADMTDKGVQAISAAEDRGQAKAQSALDENQLSDAWADLGAAFGGSAGADRMSFTLRSLSDADLLARAADLAARQLGEPSFPPEVWARDRQRTVAALAEANGRPATVAGRAFSQAVFGTHPYGAQMTAQTLDAISVADMQAFHAAHVLPCRARISVVGALDRAQTQALVERLLSRLPPAGGVGNAGNAGNAGTAVGIAVTAVTTDRSPACPPLPAVAEVAPLTAPNVQRLPFESAQAHVLIGQPGFKRDDPDFFALNLGNYTLGGGGFVSRLTQAVREKRGLSYSVYSYFAPGLHAGAFTLGLQTRPDQAAQAIEVAQSVLAEFVANGPTEAELRAAKDNQIGGFALRIDSNRKLLDNVANIAWNKLPLDYLDTWTQAVERLTVADVKAAFARKLQAQNMVTVVVGAKPLTP
jgi:zinc protease